MRFKYKAQITSGEIIEAEAEAADKFQLAHNLKAEGKKVIGAWEIRHGSSAFSRLFSDIFSHVSFKDKIFFANNLGEMINAGLSLSRSLSVIERQSPSKALKKIAHELLAGIDQGGTFSSGLARYPKVFSAVFVAMVDAGERSGRLPQSLKIISDQLQKSYELRRRVRGAMIYPAIIILAMVLIATLMMIFVVPTLAETFEEIGAKLPLSTRILIGLSGFLVSYGLWVGLSLILMFVFGFRFLRTETGRRILGRVFLFLPIFSKITVQVNSASTARTISSLVEAGVEIVEAITITERVLQNPYYKDVMKEAAAEIPKGRSLSSVFQKAERFYPVFVTEMTLVGEETGKLPEMLLKLALFYEGEVESVTKNLSTVIEPVLMILIGGAVGFFSLSMIQPIYSIGSQI